MEERISYSDIIFTDIMFDIYTPEKSCYNYIAVVRVDHMHILYFLWI